MVSMFFKRQVRSGELRAVPMSEWVTIPRKGGPLRVSELLIDSAVETWIQDTPAEFSEAQGDEGQSRAKASLITQIF